ncbi:MAG: SagB/ThcOx family dehydrogenase [Candidatus Obscuribacterales bacterium]|nr:SagB/ThcOx family dehydrogenase [Candidatus Obscuribacterales bacterium]
MLNAIRRTLDRSEVISALSAGSSDPKVLLDELLSAGLLILVDSAEDRREHLLMQWRWGIDAQFMHFSSQRVTYEEDPGAGVEQLAEYAKMHLPPSIYKTYQVDGLPLCKSTLQDAFTSVLARRRTCRSFLRKNISKEQLAEILYWTWGKQAEEEDPELGPYLLKTSPSGGARHPIEVYVAIFRVDSIPPGVYHYSVESHKLEQLVSESIEGQIEHLCGNQKWVEDAAAVFFMSAIVERSMWKYEQSFAYRVLHMDAGHLGQTFCLVATHLGLAAFSTGALDARGVEDLLGLDGVTEVILFANAVGIGSQSEIS